MKSQNHHLPFAAEPEGEPAGITPGHVAYISAVTVKAPGIGEGRDNGPSEKAELGAVGVTGQCDGRPLPEALIQESGMVGQKNHGAPSGIPRKASSAMESISISMAFPRDQG